MGWIILIVILVLLVIYLISTYNTFVRLRNSVREAFSTMDVYLKKRWDMIPNIVNTVKGFAKHEKETLEGVIKLRNGAYDSMSPEEKIATNQELSRGITKIMALAETYPDLKANTNFMDLSNQLAKVEDDISNSRKYYNAVVRRHNDKIEMFPSNLVASIFGFKLEKMFEIVEEERENVKVEF